jgi:hypothetical protein
MEKPHTYSMPEQFVTDASVPDYWKLYAILNGFWISGLPVFASNQWFAAKLKCSERNVQAGLKKLEGMGLLTRNIKGLERFILPGGTKPEFVPPRSQSSRRDEARVRHISDSNSDNLKDLAEDGVDVNQFIELFALINPSYQILFPRKPQREAAVRLLKQQPLDWWQRFMPAYQAALEDRYCPKATTPVQMEEKIGAIEHYGRAKKSEKIKSHNFII